MKKRNLSISVMTLLSISLFGTTNIHANQENAATEEAQSDKSSWQSCVEDNSQKTKLEVINECYTTLSKPNPSSQNYSGSGAANECRDTLSRAATSGSNEWKEVAKSIYSNGSSSNLNYEKAIAIYMNKFENKPEADKLNNAIKSVLGCVQVAAAMGQNLEDDRDQEDAFTNPDKLTSFDGRISCHLSGLETIDYDECATLILAQNGSQLGKVANTTFQQFQAQSQSQQIQDSQRPLQYSSQHDAHSHQRSPNLSNHHHYKSSHHHAPQQYHNQQSAIQNRIHQ